jgi:hypothetical protein
VSHETYNNVQVFVFGHPLSRTTQKWLKETYDRVRVHHVLVHVNSWSEVCLEVERVIDVLKAQGADLSGNTNTLITTTGSSTATATLLAALLGCLGKLPGVLNLIRHPQGHYAPAPELPIVGLDDFRNTVGRKARKSFMQRVDALDGVEEIVA